MRVGLGFGRGLAGLGERVAQFAELVVQVRSVALDIIRAADRVSGTEDTPRTDELLT